MNPLNPTPGNALQPALRSPSTPALPAAHHLAEFMEIPLGAGDEVSVGRIMLMLRKRKWIVIATLLVIVAATALDSFRTTPIYEAAGRVLIGRETPLVVNKNQPEFGDDFDDYIVTLETQIRILQSDAIAQQVIRDQHLDRAASLAAQPSTAGQLPSAVIETDPVRQAQLLADFHSKLRVAPLLRTRILELRYTSTDPRQAAAVVNGAMSAFIEQNYRAKLRTATETSDWLAKQLVELQVKRAKQGPDDRPVQLLADQREVDELVQCRLQLLADTLALMRHLECRQIGRCCR